MKWRAWSVAVVIGMAGVGQEVASAVDIRARVNGMDMVIGTLDASIPDATNPAQVIGEFLFAPGKEFLDEWYDFRWVNVETGYTVNGVPQMTDPLLGTLPAIDPAPFPSDPGEDNIPYYYNNMEWNGDGATFGGVVIHDEGTASRFVDRPEDNSENSLIDFTTYLVVDNVTDPTFPDKTFGVLGWFDWEYDNMGNFLNGVSDVMTVSSVVTQSDIDLITTAIGNANPNGFPGWSATKDVHLNACVPEPSTLFGLLSIGLGIVGNKRWSKWRSN